MITKKILIFGASGQVGRYCIRRLVKSNYKITAVTRNPHQKGYILKTQAPIGYLDIVQANIFDQKKLEQLLSEVDICINLIGILFEKNKLNSFENVHSIFPKKLAEICKSKKIKFLHLSALGIEQATNSKYAKSKLEGENYIRNIDSGMSDDVMEAIFTSNEGVTGYFSYTDKDGEIFEESTIGVIKNPFKIDWEIETTNLSGLNLIQSTYASSCDQNYENDWDITSFKVFMGTEGFILNCFILK